MKIARPSVKLSPFARRASVAFILIELIVAIGVFGLVMASVYSCWYSVVKSAAIGQQAAADAQRARIAIRAIQEAFETAQIFTENIRYYSFVADTSEKFPVLSFTSRLPGDFPGSGLFGDQVVRRVTFSVERGDDNQNQLIMTQMPLLEATSAEIEPYPILLARDITAFDLEFYTPGQKDWSAEFLPTNQLPSLMRVTLGLGRSPHNYSKPLVIISRVVAPAAVMITPNYQFQPH